MEALPTDLRHLRACLVCSLIKTYEQFMQNGCDNCEEHLRMRGSDELVQDCTVTTFSGMIGSARPQESWAARFQNVDGLQRGIYALRVYGKLPSEVIGELEGRGVKYHTRDR